MRNGQYEMVRAPLTFPGKLYRGKYCYEHVLVWWLNTGVVPKISEVIHHIDHNKLNNTFANLQILSRSKHVKEHSSARAPAQFIVACNNCHRVFIRNKRNIKAGLQFCSRRCIGKFRFGHVRHEITTVSMTKIRTEEKDNSIKQTHLIDKSTQLKYTEWFSQPKRKKRKCTCGKLVDSDHKFCSVKCYRNSKARYSLDDLASTDSNTQLASKYGVSVTAIRKARCKLNGAQC